MNPGPPISCTFRRSAVSVSVVEFDRIIVRTAIALVKFEKQAIRLLKSEFPRLRQCPPSRFANDVRLIDVYLSGRDVAMPFEIAEPGRTGFRKRVFDELRRVRFGRTISYAELARRAGSPGAARAVGSAMRANPLPVIIPCHRVVRADGGIGGFSAPGGVELKRLLLGIEGIRADGGVS